MGRDGRFDEDDVPRRDAPADRAGGGPEVRQVGSPPGQSGRHEYDVDRGSGRGGGGVGRPDERPRLDDIVDERLEEIRESQVEGAYFQGGQHSKEQETLISFCKQYIEPRHSDDVDPSGDYESVAARSRELRGRLSDVGLKNTDEDRILRETFRHSDEYDALTDWPPEEFLETLTGFLDEHIEASTEYQETLVKESEVRARLMCWGVIGT
jgi:hypothetical protein